MFILSETRRPYVAGGVDSITGKTIPAAGGLKYTDPAAAVTLNTADDNGNKLGDFPRARHGILQVTGGTVRYTYNGGTPTSTNGTLIADNGSVPFENQADLLGKIKFIKASGTPVVWIEPLW